MASCRETLAFGPFYFILLTAAVALGFPSLDRAHSADLGDVTLSCEKDQCNTMLFERRNPPAFLDDFVLGERKIMDLSDKEVCLHVEGGEPLFYPGNFECDDFKPKRHVTRNDEDGYEILELKSGYDTEEVFADRFRPFIPCFAVSAIYRDQNSPSTIIDHHPYFVKYPERLPLFKCRPFKTYRGYDEITYTHSASPFSVPIPYYLVQTRLSRIENVTDGEKIFAIVSSDADDTRARQELCTKMEGANVLGFYPLGEEFFGARCWAPRRIRLKNIELFDEAIAFCSHEIIADEIMPPNICSLFALRSKATGKYYMRVYSGPFYHTPGADGLGDSFINCALSASNEWRKVVEQKFPSEKGYSLTANRPWRLIRKGYVSEIYPDLREITVFGIEAGEKSVSFTLAVYFSEQNPLSQTEYRPISEMEYGFYVAKLIDRLKPELACSRGE